MKTLGYYNGKYGELDEMTVPMNDRVCWFGDGVYDAGLCRNYKIFAIDEHIDRFFNSAGLIKIQMPVTKQELKDLLNEMVRKMDTGNLFVYYQVTRGAGRRKHIFTEGSGNLWITLTPAELGDGSKPIQLITTEDTRFFHCNIKTLNLIPTVMAAQKAQEAGCQESVFYRPGGRVTECAHSNISILKDGVLRTAPTDELILPGITRKHLLALAREHGIPTLEEPFSMVELMNADEAIVTSSSALCMRVESIDHIPVGGKDPQRIKLLQDAYLEKFRRETAK